MESPGLAILYEHPEWQQPLFSALQRRGVAYRAVDLKKAVFGDRDSPPGAVVFNQASPSAYLRGNTRAVPLALAYLEDLEYRGVRVLNGLRAFRLELSKAAQISLMRSLHVPYPKTWVFNDLSALEARRRELIFPAILKPNQGGSGARMFRIQSLPELKELLESRPDLWWPDHLLLLQEYLPHDTQKEGIVRLEFLDGELLYAMRVLSGGSFNLCPSELCHPESVGKEEDPASSCSTETGSAGSWPRFVPYPEAPPEAVETARTLFRAAGLDVGGIEYLETPDGRRVFYDINANSNLRPAVAKAFGFDPFERVVDFLVHTLHSQSAFA